MGLKLTTAPLVEPVNLDELKQHLRVTITDDDGLITALGIAARGYVENYLQRQLVTATYTLTFDVFPAYAGSQVPFPFYGSGAPDTAYASAVNSYLQTPSYGVLSPPSQRRLTLPNFGVIGLPRPPLASVTSIQYYDVNGSLQTWASGNYEVVSTNEPAYIRPLNGYPTIQSNKSEAVSVVYVAGYGMPEAIPMPIRLCIKLLVSGWYENRQPSATQSGVEQAVHMILDQYRFWGFA